MGETEARPPGWERYERQLIFPPIGPEGQRKLERSKVVVVGAGGLGCPAAVYLACAGVGNLTIIDSDSVELSNLNRQILHWEENVGQPKAFSAAGKLSRLNSAIKVTPVVARVSEENAEALVSGADVVVDAVDNWPTRMLLSRACYRKGIPLVHGGVNGFVGQITTIIPGRTPCLGCAVRVPPTPKGPIPVVGATPGLVATLQVMEVLKLLVGFGELLEGRMLFVNGETMRFATVPLQARPDCAVCGNLA